MRYLVTGGAGFIGSHLADALAARGDEVLVLDDLSTGRLSNLEHLLHGDAVTLREGSVLDHELVSQAMSEVDGCFHLAAAVGVKLVVAQPLDALLRNVRGTDVVLTAACEHKRKLLFTSSSEVYGKAAGEPLREGTDRVLGSPTETRWQYSTAKGFGEALALDYVRERGAEMVVTRLFNTVGPRQTGAYGMVLPRFVRQALAGEDLTVYGNGTQSRCFLHVHDAVHALLQLFDSASAVGGVYNVGSTDVVPIVELARRVIERTRSPSKVRLVSYEEAYEPGFAELVSRRPDTSSLQAMTGWAPTRTVDEAIEDVIAYEQNAITAQQRGQRVGG